MDSFAHALAYAGLGLGLALALGAEQASAQHRMVFGGSLSLAQVHDDNLFSTPGGGEPDDISRLSSRLAVERRSHRLTLGARFGLDAEAFGRHPELNTATARREAALDIDGAPWRRLRAAARASYSEVQDPGALDSLTGLELGRVRARRLSAIESLSHRMGSLTRVTVRHTFSREEVAGRLAASVGLDGARGQESADTVRPAGGVGNDTQAVAVTLERRLGPGDHGQISYRAQRFAFGPESLVSHVVTLGWSRELTPLARFEIEAGPRLSGDTVGAEVSARFKHRSPRGGAEVAYLLTQTTVLGQPGPVTTQGVTATVNRRLAESFRVRVGPSVFRVQSQALDVMVHHLSLEVAWLVTRRLSLAASHSFSLQYGEWGAQSVEIKRNVFLLQAVAASAGN